MWAGRSFIAACVIGCWSTAFVSLTPASAELDVTVVVNMNAWGKTCNYIRKVCLRAPILHIVVMLPMVNYQ